MNLFNFTQSGHQQLWRSLDDWVMGGRSSSHMDFCEAGARFFGTISLANNGGFASIHSPEQYFDLSEHDGISLTVLGDGKTYGLMLQDNGCSQLRYQTCFSTRTGVWQTVHLSFNDFKPMVMGTQLPFAPPLNRGQIKVIGLMIADRQVGDFSLCIKQVDALPSLPAQQSQHLGDGVSTIVEW